MQSIRTIYLRQVGRPPAICYSAFLSVRSSLAAHAPRLTRCDTNSLCAQTCHASHDTISPPHSLTIPHGQRMLALVLAAPRQEQTYARSAPLLSSSFHMHPHPPTVATSLPFDSHCHSHISQP